MLPRYPGNSTFVTETPKNPWFSRGFVTWYDGCCNFGMNAILSFDNRDKVFLSAVVIIASAPSPIFLLPNSARRLIV